MTQAEKQVIDSAVEMTRAWYAGERIGDTFLASIYSAVRIMEDDRKGSEARNEPALPRAEQSPSPFETWWEAHKPSKSHFYYQESSMIKAWAAEAWCAALPSSREAPASPVVETGDPLPPWATGDFTQEFALYNMLMAWTPEQCREFYAMLSSRPDFAPPAGAGTTGEGQP